MSIKTPLPGPAPDFRTCYINAHNDYIMREKHWYRNRMFTIIEKINEAVEEKQSHRRFTKECLDSNAQRLLKEAGFIITEINENVIEVAWNQQSQEEETFIVCLKTAEEDSR